jgi:hypothetical protein
MAIPVAADAFAQRTAEADVRNWKIWSDYCAVMKTNPHRPPIDLAHDRPAFLREVVLLINALMHFMRTRKPRSAADVMIKPQSAMNILLGANRVLCANFSSFIPLSHLKLPLKGLIRRFIQRFGPKSLIPKRREPWTNGMIVAMCTLPDGYDTGPFGKLTVNSTEQHCWRAVVSLAASSGFRKAEMFLSNKTTFFLHWRNVAWVMNGTLIKSPSDEQLQGMREGDYLALSPVPSKADQWNSVWGAHPLYIPFHDLPRNAAAALRDLAVHVGTQHRQENKPVFVDSQMRPAKAAHMTTAMYNVMVHDVGASRAKLYTWHSGRISLATHLLKCGVPHATIQSLLRWQTAESLLAYARLSMSDCGSLLDQATKASIATVQTSNLPIYERFNFFLAMHEIGEAT